MRIRPILLAGRPLPALRDGAFSGSCRIQPLEVTPGGPGCRIGWIRIVGLDLGQSVADPELDVELLRQVPAVRTRMRLSELTRPYPAFHRLLFPRRLSADVVQRALQYQVQIAQALMDLEVPLRAEIRPGFEVVRPESLFVLAGEVPLEDVQGVRPRVRMDPPARSWLDHLGHLLDEDELGRWCQAVEDLDIPLRPGVLKQAVRRAKTVGDARGLPSVDQWPALECYAAITQKLTMYAVSGQALHVGGHLQLTQLEQFLGKIQPGEEQLFLSFPSGLFVVMRGEGGIPRALTWRSSYAPGDEKLRRTAAILSRCPGVTFVSRNLDVSEAR